MSKFPSPAQNAFVRMLVLGWVRPGAQDTLAKYQAAAGPIMKRYGGQPLQRMAPQTVIAGQPADVAVLMEFPSAQSCERAFQDPDYVELLPLRDEAFERLDISLLAPEG